MLRSLHFAAASAALLILSGCDAKDGERLFAPSADQLASSSHLSVASTWTVERGNKAQGLISSSGGEIAVDGHLLNVPAGAVSQPTWFSMQVVEASAVHVRLRAWRASDGAAVTQFPIVPVQLTLDVRDLDKLDPAGLVIVYLRDGTYTGAKEKVATTFNSDHWTVTGQLTHFSQYAVFREYSIGID